MPHFDYDNKKITYSVHHGKGIIPEPPKTSRGAKFKCIMCGETTTGDYIKQEAQNNRMGAELLGVVAEGPNGRIFLSPDEEQRLAAVVDSPSNAPDERLPDDPRNIWCVGYGLDTYDKLFTPRQLTAMTTFSDLVKEAQTQVEADAVNAGRPNDHIPLREGGIGARAYGEAVGLYLAFAVDREANYCSTLNGWSGEFIIQTFGRQALPMVWDYAESNPFSDSTGNFYGAINWICSAIERFPANRASYAGQFDAKDDWQEQRILPLACWHRLAWCIPRRESCICSAGMKYPKE